MEEIAEVYARSLFEVATEQDELDAVREQLGQFADALNDNRELAVFFFSPYFSGRGEEGRACTRLLSGADPIIMNFLEALIERHRMPVIFRIRSRYEEMWDDGQPAAAGRGDERGRARRGRPSRASVRGSASRPAHEIELSTVVDPDVLGGIVLRVGNFILDASIKNRLEQLRKQVAQA